MKDELELTDAFILYNSSFGFRRGRSTLTFGGRHILPMSAKKDRR